MFDRIADRYDLLNRLLSFRRDVAWRKKMLTYLPDRRPLDILDIATGTADQLLSFARIDGLMSNGVGIDMSEEMLAVGRRKIADRGLDQSLTLKTGDAMHVPFPDQSFDTVTISFGIRNVLDIEAGIAEMARVLRPGGTALILEFSTPVNRLFRPLYLVYLRHVLPILGGLISGEYKAYKYLNRTIETFPYGEDFCELMRRNGFAQAKPHPLTFGIATIYEGISASE